MNPMLAAGLMIGVSCGAWIFVMGLTGWYKNPTMAWAFFAVVLIEVVGLVWGLRRTALEGRGYGGQVVAGAMIATVAGVVIICSSLLFTTVAFPNYFNELESVRRTTLAERGLSDAEIDRQLAESRGTETPMNHALLGFTGTLITGIVAAGIIAIWVRSRSQIARNGTSEAGRRA